MLLTLSFVLNLRQVSRQEMVLSYQIQIPIRRFPASSPEQRDESCSPHQEFDRLAAREGTLTLFYLTFSMTQSFSPLNTLKFYTSTVFLRHNTLLVLIRFHSVALDPHFCRCSYAQFSLFLAPFQLFDWNCKGLPQLHICQHITPESLIPPTRQSAFAAHSTSLYHPTTQHHHAIKHQTTRSRPSIPML